MNKDRRHTINSEVSQLENLERRTEHRETENREEGNKAKATEDRGSS